MFRRLLSVLLATFPLAANAQTAPLAAAPDPQSGVVLQMQPAAYRFMVGGIRVTALSDGTAAIDLHQLLLRTTPALTDSLLQRSFLKNPVESSINVYLLELPDRRVLVDTGAGELFGPGNGGKLMGNLAALGISPEQINDILITHVHSDHSGGLAKGGKIVFPNATVHVGQPDVTFFLDRANAARTGYEIRYFDEAEVTLKPYVDAGKVKAFSENGQILPGIRAELQPGHTPGSAFYTLESRGQKIVFIGDVIHIGAVQFPVPSITIKFDQDSNKAAKVRAKAFAKFAGSATLLAAPHLPFPGVGHIRREAKGFRWFPIEYGDREVSAPSSNPALGSKSP